MPKNVVRTAPRTAAKHLARLAHLVQALAEKQDLYVELLGLVERLQRSGFVVEGQAWVVGELKARLDEGRRHLALLVGEPPTREAIQLLDDLESLLDDVVWELAEQMREDLKERTERLQKQLRKDGDLLADWQSRIREAGQLLVQAQARGAPVKREIAELERLDGLVAQGGRWLAEQKHDLLTATLDALSPDRTGGRFEQIDRIRAQIQAKLVDTQAFARQADLLLLHAPADARGRFHYTVLLRTPSEPGVHGINIQESSTLVQQDRDMMTEIINEVTAAIDQGLVRSFQTRAALAGGGAPLPGGETAAPTRSPRHLGAAPAVGGAAGEPGNANALLAEVGDLMYRLFMPEPMQRYLSDIPCSLTITSNDLELPWELMADRSGFLCLERPVARMPMGRALPRMDEQPKRAAKKLRFLLVYADPDENLPDARAEVEMIRDALLGEEFKNQIEVDVLTLEASTGSELNKRLRGGTYDVIHFAGHAEFDAADADLSGLLLYKKEVFFAQKIRRLLKGRPLVFLNACQSGRTANEERQPQRVEQYLQKPAEGLASAFIYGGALGCIGSLWPIYDDAAAQFAITFYGKVLEGYMIGEAMRLARREIQEKFPDQITWAAFVLYGNPTFVL